MKKLTTTLLLLLSMVIISSCGSKSESSESENQSEGTESESSSVSDENPSYDPHRGEGKFTDIEVNAEIDAAVADYGSKVYDVKCSSCHKLSDERLVGPGWKGVTARRQAPWILNFITNTDAMLNKDPEAQAQLEICLVRMPNQSLSDEEAKGLYEFMRKNDVTK